MKRFRTFAAIFLLLSGLAYTQVNGDRLILKDGTYQIVTKYQIRGDRVRFFSAERNEWEEMPKDLVDWAATARWKRDRGSAENSDQVGTQTNPNDPEQQEAAKIDAQEKAARAAELARMPIILPGLRLPDESGIWVLDTYDGRPELAHLTQANGDLNRAYQHSVLPHELGSERGERDLVRINGYKAPVELHVSQPVFYVSLDAPKGAEEAESMGKPLTVDTRGASSLPDDKRAHSSPDSRYVILTLEGGKNLRKASAMDLDGILGSGQPVNVTKTTKEILPGGRWMKVTPRNTLAFGQYAIVEVLSPRDVNADVWAFGVDPTAEENKATVGPVDQQ